MLAILTTHPIQYQVPLWQALARDGRIPFEVWYLSQHGTQPSFDVQFKKSFAWDLDMLEGYPQRSLLVNANQNVSRFDGLRLREPMTKLISRLKVSALWIQGWQVLAYWQAVSQADANGVPVWLRGESNDLAPMSAWKRPVKRIALRWLFSRVSEFLYIGQANRRFYESHGISSDHLHPAHYGVDNDRFSSQATMLRARRSEIRKQWKIPEDSFCILFAGKFMPKKRPFDVIRAASEFAPRSNGRPIHLVFAGTGELGTQLRRQCRVVYDGEGNYTSSKNGGDSTKPGASFLGFLNQTEISKAYVAADCLMLPSNHGETWGLVINEAMASSLPCIASNECGCSEDLLAPIHQNLRFRVGNTEEMVRALSTVLSGEIPVEDFRNRVERYRLDVSLKTVMALYERMRAQS